MRTCGAEETTRRATLGIDPSSDRQAIADVAAQSGSGVAGKLDALRELRERFAAQLLDEDEATRARPTK
jgi:hypothetical protein